MAAGTRLRVALVAAIAISAISAPAAGAATINVTSEADASVDDADCSLREAITAANTDANGHEDACAPGSSGSGDTIQLAAGATYAIGATDAEAGDANVDGDFDVGPGSGGVTIQGGGDSGVGITVVDAAGLSRAFHVTSPAGALTLRDLRIEDGDEDGTDGGVGIGGGGIGSNAAPGNALALDGVTVADSQAVGSGGGIHTGNPSTLSLTDSVVSGNQTTSGFGGGGIFAQNGMTVAGSQISGNSSLSTSSGSGGGGAFVSGSSVVSDSIVNGNTANGGGGGGIRRTGGSLQVVRSQVSGNHALDNTGAGGAIRFDQGFAGDLLVEDSTLDGNDAVGVGGAVAFVPQTAGATLTVRRSALTDNVVAGLSGLNSATVGGGIHSGGTNPGPALVEDTVVARNRIDSVGLGPDADGASGAGINQQAQTFNGSITIRRSAIAANGVGGGAATPTSVFGAGVRVFEGGSGSATVVNSTISGNGGGGSPSVQGSGVSVQGAGTFRILSSTVAANQATAGGAVHAFGASTSATLSASVIAGGSSGCLAAGGATISSNGFNVDQGTSCGFVGSGDTEGADPALAALADNSGPLVGAPGATERLQTHALGIGSPALARVPAASCLDESGGPLTTDARGVARPQAGACESGAYEELASEPAPAAPAASRCKPGFKLKKVKRKGKKPKRKCVRAKKKKKRKRKRK